ncbi:MAG: hypothetical protein JWR61_1040 [Ferruginibacter sp.]|uniref:hypothetical protein n=1 Tax=Ferruginibacter sp. TaxID=1940288 RepID=UPI00265B5EE0|nr:hypothetical protein [Ferruginibacter sp.]MDB5276085.1 hypothetical protein [Ferruginibacter sp.]
MKLLTLFTAIIFYSSLCFAQTDTTTVINTDSTAPKATLTLATVYANNASYYGQKSAENTPYAALAATYRFKSGFYFSGLAYKLLNDKTSSVSASSLGAGVNFKPAQKLSADLSYSHSFYPAYSPLLQAGNADNASIALTYESWLNISLAGDYAFGKTSDEFVTGGISKSINLFSIGKKDIVTINPSADIVAGSQHFYKTYLTEQKLRDSVLGILLSPITGTPSQGPAKTTTTTTFNLLSYNFKLPLAYNRAHYVLEAAYQLSVLSNYAQTDPGKANSFITLSFYYQF